MLKKPFLLFQAKSEEALQQTRAEFASHVASGRNEHAQISSKLESETQTRARLESEVSHICSYIQVMCTYCFGKCVFDPVVKLFERPTLLLNFLVGESVD